jgi:hypothetical protein
VSGISLRKVGCQSIGRTEPRRICNGKRFNIDKGLTVGNFFNLSISEYCKKDDALYLKQDQIRLRGIPGVNRSH